MLAVAGGLCKHVLVLPHRVGVDVRGKQRAAMSERAAAACRLHVARIGGDMQWRIPFGASSAANWIGMQATAHFDRYGTTRETLGWIALERAQERGAQPWAIYKEPLTMDDYLTARHDHHAVRSVRLRRTVRRLGRGHRVAEGPRRPTCSSRRCTSRPSAPQITERMSWDQGTLDHEPLVHGTGRAPVDPHRPAPDRHRHGASSTTASRSTACRGSRRSGSAAWGEAKDFLDGGTNIALDGVLPLNTHGGQLSSGRLHGYGFVHEAVTQLRGRRRRRQVPDAETAVVSNGGGAPGRRVPLHQGALSAQR